VISKFKIPLSKIIDDFRLRVIYTPDDPKNIFINETEVNRAGLQLTGYFEGFENNCTQIIGKTEMAYISNLDPEVLYQRVETLFGFKPPMVVFSGNIKIPDFIRQAAKRHGVPLLLSDLPTAELLQALIGALNTGLAPRITRHGVLMEVHGEGVLILGESGIGKSETAVELLARGHRLIADDAVEIRRVSSRSLVGSSPSNIRHFMELRGIGVINARRIFGMSAVKMSETVDMIVQFEHWDERKHYDRMGMTEEYMQVLGVRVPTITVPVRPGRNLAVIIEVAVLNQRLKKTGYVPAVELMRHLGVPEELVVRDEHIIEDDTWDA
jgi:HPr kinase/phosphorylase